MGGLAIKKLIGKEGERFSRSDLDRYKSILAVFSKDIEFPAEVLSKDSFGDIDCLFPSESIFPGWEKALMELFEREGVKAQGYSRNSSVYSFALGEKQVDVNLVPTEFMESSMNYFSNNDLGNLIGRIAHSLGLKYGSTGLLLPVKYDNHSLGELRLSTNYRRILSFLGFSEKDVGVALMATYLGFETSEDVFEFVTRSKYFKGEGYKLENLNAENRVRNEKRKTYMNFISYLESTGKIDQTPGQPLLKEYFQTLAVKTFGKQEEFLSLLLEQKEREFQKEMFNGTKVFQRYSLEKEDLGRYMGAFYKACPKENLVNMTYSDVDRVMQEVYESLSK